MLPLHIISVLSIYRSLKRSSLIRRFHFYWPFHGRCYNLLFILSSLFCFYLFLSYFHEKKSFKFSIICRKNFSEISSMCIGRRALTQLFLTLNQFKGYVPFIHLPSNLPTHPRLPENSRKPNIFWCFQEL